VIYQPVAHSAVYDTKIGSWTAGPDLPNHEGGGDTFANLLPNGNVFFQTNPPGTSEDAATRANARYASIRNRTMHPLGAEAPQQSTCNLGIYRAYGRTAPIETCGETARRLVASFGHSDAFSCLTLAANGFQNDSARARQASRSAR
jgi:hypothetical protein